MAHILTRVTVLAGHVPRDGVHDIAHRGAQDVLEEPQLEHVGLHRGARRLWPGHVLSRRPHLELGQPLLPAARPGPLPVRAAPAAAPAADAAARLVAPFLGAGHLPTAPRRPHHEAQVRNRCRMVEVGCTNLLYKEVRGGGFVWLSVYYYLDRYYLRRSFSTLYMG